LGALKSAGRGGGVRRERRGSWIVWGEGEVGGGGMSFFPGNAGYSARESIMSDF
jgi:hypothetical protein